MNVRFKKDEARWVKRMEGLIFGLYVSLCAERGGLNLGNG